MKKLALTSLLAMFAVSGAHAANVIDGNPLYMPKAGHFYSETVLAGHTHTDPNDIVGLGEEFGYGVTDQLAISVGTTLWENEEFDDYAWDGLSLKATFRALESDGFVADVYGGVSYDGMYLHTKNALADGKKNHWFDKDLSDYTWMAGIRGGYISDMFTIAGHAEFNYNNAEMFRWGWYGEHTLSLGLDGQFVIDQNWNLVGGVEYTGVLDDYMATYSKDKGIIENKNEGVWEGYFGVNYNIDATKYVGAYIEGSLNHHGGDAADEWDWDKGFGFGMKFGIDF